MNGKHVINDQVTYYVIFKPHTTEPSESFNLFLIDEARSIWAANCFIQKYVNEVATWLNSYNLKNEEHMSEKTNVFALYVPSQVPTGSKPIMSEFKNYI